jgi:leader peptidase (prepilin peptidase)/N-methyltransferase
MIYLLSAVITGTISDYCLSKYYKPVYYPYTVIISMITCVILTHAFDERIVIVKGFIFCQSLILIAYCDIKTHEIPNVLLIPIIACGFINFKPIQSLIGFFSVSILFFVVSAVTKGKGVGGGDVKLIAAAGFVLGTESVMFGTLIGLILYLMFYLIAHNKLKQKMYAMAPWLGTGCFLAYISF